VTASSKSRPLTALLAAAAAVAVLGIGTNARADEPVRPQRHDVGVYPTTSTRLPLFLIGAGTTAVFYGAAVGPSYLWPTAPGASDLRIPIAGPFMALGKTGCAKDDPGCSTLIVVLRALLTGIDGVGQVGGLGFMGEALFLPTTVDSPAAARRRRRLESARSFEIHPVPIMSGKDGVGLGVIGRF
jgi:hypothetical protein